MQKILEVIGHGGEFSLFPIVDGFRAVLAMRGGLVLKCDATTPAEAIRLVALRLT